MVIPSKMLPLGTPCPDFSLPDVVTGNIITLKSYAARKLLLITFTARHCPYAQHVKEGVAKLGRDYAEKNIGFIAICSSDINAYPLDSPENLKEMAKEIGLNFPLCFDETQSVAKSLQAACTPDFFLFDQNRRLIYRGQMDDSRPGGDLPVSGKDIRAAIEAALTDQPVNPEQKPSIGCSIKWKPGNEPPYIGNP